MLHLAAGRWEVFEVRSVVLTLGVLCAVTAQAAPTLLGQPPPRIYTAPEHVDVRLAEIDHELSLLPSRRPGVSMMIAGFAAAVAVGAGGMLVLSVVALLPLLTGGSLSWFLPAALVVCSIAAVGLMVGVVGVVLFIMANTARAEPEARLEPEKEYLEKMREDMLRTREAPPLPPVPAPAPLDVHWQAAPVPALVLAQF